MNLVLDIGNTSTKAGIFDGNELEKVYQNITTEDLTKALHDHKITSAIVSTVVRRSELYPESLKAINPIILSHTLPLPITLDYKTPETLGHDRIAGVCGAKALFPDDTCLVIDCGTCITYDLITNKDVYMGGAISPGLDMRFKALNTFTSNLPLIYARENVAVTGQSTKECIQSGVVNGILGEIEAYVGHYSAAFLGLRVVMCGGDTIFFENKVKARIFAAPELVLRGLNRILIHNA